MRSVSELGRGATGIVLVARHRQLGRFVAVKVLSPELADHPDVRRRFAAEAKLLASFSHVHIVPIYDFVERDGLCLLIMERLTGGTLARHRSRRARPAGGAAPPCSRSARRFSTRTSAASSIATSSPTTRSGRRDGVLKMTDFGIAKVLGGVETQLTRTRLRARHAGLHGARAGRGLRPGSARPTSTRSGRSSMSCSPAGCRSSATPTCCRCSTGASTWSRSRCSRSAPEVPAGLAAWSCGRSSAIRADRYRTAEEFGIAVAKAATGVWGRGWLEQTPFAVTAGPILSAAQDRAGGGPRSPAGVARRHRRPRRTATRRRRRRRPAARTSRPPGDAERVPQPERRAMAGASAPRPATGRPRAGVALLAIAARRRSRCWPVGATSEPATSGDAGGEVAASSAPSRRTRRTGADC